MNGDLRLLRRRWWGSWAIGATALLALCWLVQVAFEPRDGSPGMQPRAAIGLSGLMLAVLLCCYAPWTFFGVLRGFGLLVFLSTIAYVVDEVRLGRYVTQPGRNQSALNALHALLLFGLPCLWVALLKRPQVCPYDERGHARPFEVERTFRVVPMVPVTPELEAKRSAAKRTVKFDYAGMSRLEVLDPTDPPLLRVTLPMDGNGAEVWRDWQRRLAEEELHCDVVEEHPGRRSFERAVWQSVHGRWKRGRRVPTAAERSDGDDAGPG